MKGERHHMYKGRMLCVDKQRLSDNPVHIVCTFRVLGEGEELERDPCFESAPFTNVQRTNDVASQSDVSMLRAQCDKNMCLTSLTRAKPKEKMEFPA